VTLVPFVVDKWWTYCWGKQNQIFGPARNQRLYAVESIGLEVLFVISNGNEHERQNYGMHQSRRGCFNLLTASFLNSVMANRYTLVFLQQLDI
jgi:hypothetical protein